MKTRREHALNNKLSCLALWRLSGPSDWPFFPDHQPIIEYQSMMMMMVVVGRSIGASLLSISTIKTMLLPQQFQMKT